MHPLDEMECPGCNRVLPADAPECPCGYRFVAPSRSQSYAPERAAIDAAAGSFGWGVVLGFFCGCIGYAIAHFGKLGPRTKEGVVVGWIAGFVLGVLAEVLRRTITP